MYAVHSIDDESDDISLRPQDPYWMDMMHQVLKCSNFGCCSYLRILSGWEIDPKSSTHNESFLAREHFQFDSETVRIP